MYFGIRTLVQTHVCLQRQYSLLFYRTYEPTFGLVLPYVGNSNKNKLEKKNITNNIQWTAVPAT